MNLEEQALYQVTFFLSERSSKKVAVEAIVKDLSESPLGEMDNWFLIT